ncbi:MAG: hypothetical protein ABMB14_24230, partial [Myxococcota bacterium]
PTGGDPSQLAWQGDTLVVDLGDGRVQPWSAGRGAPLGDPYPVSTEAVARFVLAPNGRSLAVTGRRARVLNTEDGAVVAELDAQWGGVVTAAWTPDGLHLATAGGDGTVVLWETTAWRVGSLIEGAHGRQLAFSADGERLLSASWDGGVVASRRDGVVVERLAFDGLLASAAWSQAGIAMVDSAGNLSVWR